MTGSTSSDRSLVRVVHVAGSAEWGGGERYLELFARHLDRDRFALSVIAPAPGPLCAQLAALGVEVHVVDLGALVSLRAILALAARLRGLAPHVVQSHGARSGFYTRIAGRLAGVPVVVSTMHNSLRDYPVSRPRLALYRAMERLTMPLGTCVICVAAALARDRAPGATVIHNGVDLDDFDLRALAGVRREQRQKLGLEGAPVVGFVGWVAPQKDPLTFIRVLAAVRRERPDVQGLVVGDGPLRAAVEAEARSLGVTASCRFVGARSDVPALLAAMDVVVLTSVSEGLPFVILEAMATERPVVATAVNGVPEIVEDGVTGRLAPAGDVAALARATLDVLTVSDAGPRMGQAGRRRIAQCFTAQRMVVETQHLYLRLLSAAPAAAATGA